MSEEPDAVGHAIAEDNDDGAQAGGLLTKRGEELTSDMTSTPGELINRVRALDPAERVMAAVHLLDILEEIDGPWSDTRDPGDPPAETRRLTYGEILDAGTALPLSDRADLVWELVHTLDEDWIAQNRAPIDPEWRNEITRRLEDILLGQVPRIDRPEALRLIRALLYLRTTGEPVRSVTPALDEAAPE